MGACGRDYFVLNARVNAGVETVNNSAIRALLEDCGAYARASRAVIQSLPGVTKMVVVSLYISSLRVTRIVAASISCVGFLLATFEKRVDLVDMKKISVHKH